MPSLPRSLTRKTQQQQLLQHPSSRAGVTTSTTVCPSRSTCVIFAITFVIVSLYAFEFGLHRHNEHTYPYLVQNQTIINDSKAEEAVVVAKPEEIIPSFQEGFWASHVDPAHDAYHGKYPWPTPSIPWPYQDFTKQQFLAKLAAVENWLQTHNDGEGVLSFRGLSKCRLCGEFVGNKEYQWHIGRGSVVSWPAGYMHYIEVHEVAPSK
eukprot:PhF_6_TR7287/c0_g1_i1/m.10886